MYTYMYMYMNIYIYIYIYICTCTQEYIICTCTLYVMNSDFLDEVIFDQVPTHCSAILYRKPMTLLI